MSSANQRLTIQMLEWIARAPRTREDVLAAWRTSCPRLSIWEDAYIDGLVEFADGGVVTVSSKGARLLTHPQQR